MTTNTAQAIDALIANLAATLKTDELIERARAALEIPPADDAIAGNVVKISDPVQASLLNELLAQASEAKRVADAALADYDAVKDLLTEVLGEDHDELKVHNQLVFTAKYSEQRILNQSYIKSRFPDIEGNEDYWTTSRRRNRLFK